jgi:hypothetical protein
MHNYYNDFKYQVKFYYNLTKTGVYGLYKDYIESNLFKAFEYLEDSYYELFYGKYVPYQPGIKGYKCLQKIAYKAAYFSISKDAEKFKLLMANSEVDDKVDDNMNTIACFDKRFHIDFNSSDIELKNLIIWRFLISKASSSAICEEEFFDKIMKKFDIKNNYTEKINKELQDYFYMHDIKSVSEFETLINNYCPSKSDLANGIATEKHIICTIFQDFPEIFQDS